MVSSRRWPDNALLLLAVCMLTLSPFVVDSLSFGFRRTALHPSAAVSRTSRSHRGSPWASWGAPVRANKASSTDVDGTKGLTLASLRLALRAAVLHLSKFLNRVLTAARELLFGRRRLPGGSSTAAAAAAAAASLEIAYMRRKKQEADARRVAAWARGAAREQLEREQRSAAASAAALASSTGAEKKRVLILMSDTGGGHRASAEAIERAMAEQHPGKVDVTICDIWSEHAVAPFNQFPRDYRYLAKNPLLWRIMYAYGAFGPTKLFTEVWSWLACYRRFKKAITDAAPDLVISVHPLCQLMPISIVAEMNRARKDGQLPVSFVTVVTDLGGAHSTWFDKRADFCFVPSEAVKRVALRNGVAPEKIVMHGLPIRPAFWRKSPKAKNALRGSLLLEPEIKTVLLMGGGDGVGGLEQIAVQVVVICGNNVDLAERLRARTYPANVRVVVKGFQKNIDEFMAACDLLVTKAGPGTIAEAMVQGLPMVLSSFLPGQEAGNVPYVVDGGFGVYTGNNPRKIGDVVYRLFNEEPGRLQEMSERARAQSRAESSQLISKDIAAIALRKDQSLPTLKSSM